MIVGIRSPAGSLESPAVIRDGELYEFIGYAAAMDLPYAVYRRGWGLHGNGSTRISMLLARESYTLTMDRITPNHINNFVVLVGSGTEGLSAIRDVVE